MVIQPLLGVFLLPGQHLYVELRRRSLYVVAPRVLQLGQHLCGDRDAELGVDQFAPSASDGESERGSSGWIWLGPRSVSN